MVFQDVGVNVEPILILVSCRLFIGVVREADSKINLHVPPLFHSADRELASLVQKSYSCCLNINILNSKDIFFLGFRNVLLCFGRSRHHFYSSIHPTLLKLKLLKSK